MDWNALSPYLLPLLIAAIFLRRALRAQKPKTIRVQRLWIFPTLLLACTLLSLEREHQPGFLVILLFMVASALGAAIGWFRVHTLEFSFDEESGVVSARATRLGALLIFALIALRYAADLGLKKLGLSVGTDLVHATDAMLVLWTSMFVARSVHTWIRARTLLAGRGKPAIGKGVPTEPGN